VALGAEEAAALRLLRTCADALRRLTQAEAELYESQIQEPQPQAGASEQDLMRILSSCPTTIRTYSLL
jgi:hypothetical protein